MKSFYQIKTAQFTSLVLMAHKEFCEREVCSICKRGGIYEAMKIWKNLFSERQAFNEPLSAWIVPASDTREHLGMFENAYPEFFNKLVEQTLPYCK